jgi:hypothetical protein
MLKRISLFLFLLGLPSIGLSQPVAFMTGDIPHWTLSWTSATQIGFGVGPNRIWGQAEFQFKLELGLL